MTNVTAPLSSVDDVSSVITVGGGVVVTMKVVGVKDVTVDGLCNEGVDLMVLGDNGEGGQVPKSVEMGLASVMRLVMTSGTDIVETPPMQPLI